MIMTEQKSIRAQLYLYKGEILMAHFLSKISKAVDAFTDVLVEDIDSKKNVAIYKYDDFKKFLIDKQKKEPRVKKCIIAVTQEKEFDGISFPEVKYLIRIILLDETGLPIPIGNSTEEFMGDIIIASAIDTKLKNYMGNKKEKTVFIKEG